MSKKKAARAVLINSAHHLQSQVSSIANLIRSLSGDWEERDAALNSIVALTQSPDMPDYISALEKEVACLRKPLAEQLKDLRSSIVRSACGAISALAKCLGVAFEPHAEYFTPLLLKLTVITKEVIAHSGNDCMKELMKHVKSGRLLPILVEEYHATKNQVLRQRAVEQAHNLLAAMNEDDTDHTRGIPVEDLTASLLESALDDAGAKVRSGATALYWFFHGLYPEAAEELCARLPSARKKMVGKGRPTSGTDVSKAATNGPTRMNRRRRLKPNRAFAAAASSTASSGVMTFPDEPEADAPAEPESDSRTAPQSFTLTLTGNRSNSGGSVASSSVMSSGPQRMPRAETHDHSSGVLSSGSMAASAAPSPVPRSVTSSAQRVLRNAPRGAAAPSTSLRDVDSTTGIIVRTADKIEEAARDGDWQTQMECFSTLKGVWDRYGSSIPVLSSRTLRRVLVLHVESLRDAQTHPKLAATVLKSLAPLIPIFSNTLVPILRAPLEADGPAVASVLLSLVLRAAKSSIRMQSRLAGDVSKALYDRPHGIFVVQHALDVVELALDDNDVPMLDGGMEFVVKALQCEVAQDETDRSKLEEDDMLQLISRLGYIAIDGKDQTRDAAMESLRLLHNFNTTLFLRQLESVEANVLLLLADGMPQLGLLDPKARKLDERHSEEEEEFDQSIPEDDDAFCAPRSITLGPEHSGDAADASDDGSGVERRRQSIDSQVSFASESRQALHHIKDIDDTPVQKKECEKSTPQEAQSEEGQLEATDGSGSGFVTPEDGSEDLCHEVNEKDQMIEDEPVEEDPAIVEDDQEDDAKEDMEQEAQVQCTGVDSVEDDTETTATADAEVPGEEPDCEEVPKRIESDQKDDLATVECASSMAMNQEEEIAVLARDDEGEAQMATLDDTEATEEHAALDADTLSDALVRVSKSYTKWQEVESLLKSADDLVGAWSGEEEQESRQKIINALVSLAEVTSGNRQTVVLKTLGNTTKTCGVEEYWQTVGQPLVSCHGDGEDQEQCPSRINAAQNDSPKERCLKVTLRSLHATMEQISSEVLSANLGRLMGFLHTVLKSGEVAHRKAAVECIVEAAYRLELNPASAGPDSPLSLLNASQRKLVGVYLKKRSRITRSSF